MANGKPGPDKGDPRIVEAGKKGEETVKAERGREFYVSIGAKGGQLPRRKGQAKPQYLPLAG